MNLVYAPFSIFGATHQPSSARRIFWMGVFHPDLVGIQVRVLAILVRNMPSWFGGVTIWMKIWCATMVSRLISEIHDTIFTGGLQLADGFKSASKVSVRKNRRTAFSMFLNNVARTSSRHRLPQCRYCWHSAGIADSIGVAWKAQTALLHQAQPKPNSNS